MPRYLTIYFYQKNPRKIVKKSNKGYMFSYYYLLFGLWPIQWKGQKTLLWRHESQSVFLKTKPKKLPVHVRF